MSGKCSKCGEIYNKYYYYAMVFLALGFIITWISEYTTLGYVIFMFGFLGMIESKGKKEDLKRCKKIKERR